jgi:predicted transcriptional regulator
MVLVAPLPKLTTFDLKKKGYPTSPQTLGEHLKRWRLDHRLSQEKVASILGTTDSTIADWERNRRPVSQSWQPMILKLIDPIAGLHSSHEEG